MILAQDVQGLGRRRSRRTRKAGTARRSRPAKRPIARSQRARRPRSSPRRPMRSRRCAQRSRSRPPRTRRPAAAARSLRRRLQARRRLVATREAYGTALARARRGRLRASSRSMPTSGNSTFSERFEKVVPERFYENFIAEQVMIGAAMGLAARGAIPFPSTFACFLSRALRLHPHGRDQQPRTSSWPASHAGVSIGEDGPVADGARRSGDDARRAEHHGALSRATRSAPSGCVELAAYHPGPGVHPHEPAEDAGHLRATTSRSRSADSKVLRASRPPTSVTVVGAGVTVFEALKALRPAEGDGHRDSRDRRVLGAADRSRRTLVAAARATRRRVDHRRGSLRGRRASATRSPRRCAPAPASPCSRLAVARFPAAASPKNCSIASASRAAHIVAAVQSLNDRARACRAACGAPAVPGAVAPLHA